MSTMFYPCHHIWNSSDQIVCEMKLVKRRSYFIHWNMNDECALRNTQEPTKWKGGVAQYGEGAATVLLAAKSICELREANFLAASKELPSENSIGETTRCALANPSEDPSDSQIKIRPNHGLR